MPHIYNHNKKRKIVLILEVLELEVALVLVLELRLVQENDKKVNRAAGKPPDDPTTREAPVLGMNI